MPLWLYAIKLISHQHRKLQLRRKSEGSRRRANDLNHQIRRISKGELANTIGRLTVPAPAIVYQVATVFIIGYTRR